MEPEVDNDINCGWCGWNSALKKDSGNLGPEEEPRPPKTKHC